MISASLVVLFLLLLLLGLPVAICLGLSSALVIATFGLPISVLGQRMVNALDSSPLLAVPLFILAANLLNASGATQHLFDLIRMIVGRIRGGVAQVSILVSLIFSGISGAALADIGALGRIQIQMMEEQGYKKEFAAGITMAAATIGPIFPPSIPIIIFATTTNISAVQLLIAGIIPALLITFLLIIQTWVLSRWFKLPRDESTFSPTTFIRKLIFSLPAIFAPFLLIGGLVSGWFGPTETAGITVIYALFIGTAIYRRINWKKMLRAVSDSVEATASVLFIVAMAALFAWVLTMDRVPVKASQILLELSSDPLVLLLIVNLLLLIVGMVLESIAAILIIAPIVTPALTAAGVDPLQLGIVFVLNLMIGLLTPPVGMSLYMISIITKMPFHHVVRGVLPFLIPLMASLIIVSLIPQLSTYLPNYFMR